MDNKNISILIPTISRPKLLLNQLHFYINLKANFKIIICDSTPNPSQSFLNTIKNFSDSLNIDYSHKPGLNDREAIWFLISSCDTKYSAFIGDDDFFIPEGLNGAMNFLEKNLDYRIAYGNSIVIEDSSLSSRFSRIISSDYLGKISFKQKTMLERISAIQKNNFITVFGVHRTSEFVDDYKSCRDIPSRTLAETFADYSTIARGKSNYLPMPYLIRRQHKNRYLMPYHIVDSLINDGVGESIPLLKKLFTDLVLESGINIKEAKEISNQIVKSILLNLYNKSPKFKRNHSYLSIFRLIYSPVKRIYYGIKNILFRNSKYFSLFSNYIFIIKNIN